MSHFVSKDTKTVSVNKKRQDIFFKLTIFQDFPRTLKPQYRTNRSIRTMPTGNWKQNPASAIILKDLEDGSVPLFRYQKSAQHAFHEHYRDNGTVQSVGFKEFKKRLSDHRGQVQRRKQNPPQKPPPFPWRKSEAKCIILEDLYRGVLSLEKNALNPRAKMEQLLQGIGKRFEQRQ